MGYTGHLWKRWLEGLQREMKTIKNERKLNVLAGHERMGTGTAYPEISTRSREFEILKRQVRLFPLPPHSKNLTGKTTFEITLLSN